MLTVVRNLKWWYEESLNARYAFKYAFIHIKYTLICWTGICFLYDRNCLRYLGTLDSIFNFAGFFLSQQARSVNKMIDLFFCSITINNKVLFILEIIRLIEMINTWPEFIRQIKFRVHMNLFGGVICKLLEFLVYPSYSLIIYVASRWTKYSVIFRMIAINFLVRVTN